MIANGGPEAVAISRARYEAFAAARNEVRLLGNRHNMILQWPRDNWRRLVLPALFSEIFDINKVDETTRAEAAAAAAAAAAAEAAATTDTATVATVAEEAEGAVAASDSVASSSQSPHSSDQFSQLG